MVNTINAIRNRELAQIHIAKKDLCLDDDTYRAMLWTIGRVRSAGELDHAGRRRVLEHLTSRGWTNKPASRAKARALANDEQSRKIRALWLALHAAGAVANPSEAALAAYVKRITRVEALQWLKKDQASRVIETLKKWLGRL